MININSFTIFFVCSTWGCWEPNSLKKIMVPHLFGGTRVRGYAGTRIILYVQLHQDNSLFKNKLIWLKMVDTESQQENPLKVFGSKLRVGKKTMKD